MIWAVPAPASNTNLENRILRHIVENLVFDKGEHEGIQWVDQRPVEEVPRDSSLFYDKKVWARHQAEMLEILVNLQTSPGDVFLFADFWFPGMEVFELSLPHKVHKIGFVHGSSFMPEDAVFGWDWAQYSELAWGRLFDQILVQTEWSVAGMPSGMKKKFVVVGSPFENTFHFRGLWNIVERKYDFVWPFRFSDDKGYKKFLHLAKELRRRGHTVVVTTPAEEIPASIAHDLFVMGVTVIRDAVKSSFWGVLSQCKVVVSTARQETWGYSVMEAVACGCVPVLPNYACYPLLYPEKYLYDPDAQIGDVADFCVQALRHGERHEVRDCTVRGKIEGGLFRVMK